MLARYEILLAFHNEEGSDPLPAIVTIEWSADQHEAVSDALALIKAMPGVEITGRRQTAVRPNHGKRAKLASAVTK